MKWRSKGVFFLAWGLFFMLLAGCITVPEAPEDPYLGYVYLSSLKGNKKFKQDAVESALNRCKEQIAMRELSRRRETFDVHDRSLEKREAFIRYLEQPIEIEEDSWKGAIDGRLNKKEKKALLAYWEANKPLKFYGSASLFDWNSVLSNVRTQLGIDTAKAEKIESDIERLRKENRFRDALAKVNDLEPYKREKASELRKSLKEEGADYWIGKHRAEIDGLRNAKVYDDAHEKKVMDLYYKLCDDVKVFGNREDFNGVFAGWADLLGENWRKRIVEMGENKEYWKAYEFAKERYNEYVDTKRYAKSYREGLRLKIGKGYLEILDKAIRNYFNLASTAYKTNGLGGKAYVYSCMANEMFDFVTVAGLGYKEDVEDWHKRISALEGNELRPALSARVARRLVIHDIEFDTLGLSKKFRQSCLKKYAPGNNHAFGLEVVTDKVALAQFENGTRPIEPDDYVVEWSRADFKVKARRGHTSQEYIFVRTDRIKLVDNPFRKDKSSEFHKLKKIKAQEVDQYLLSQTPIEVDLSCKMEVSCQHRGTKERLGTPLTDKLIKKTYKVYNGAADIDVTCSYPNFPPETKYYPPDQYNNTIPMDSIPEEHEVKLLEDDWFEKNAPKVIIADLGNELGSLIDMYPVELLSDADRDAPSKYLDSLGTVLFYVVNLSSMEACNRESAGKGYEWLHLRDQVADNTKKWCGEVERWGAVGADEKKILRSLWRECVKVGKEQDGR